MAKKSLKKSTSPLASQPGAKQAHQAYPAEPHELNRQRQRLKQAAALGAAALKPSAPAATPDPHPAPAAVSPPPLTPPAASGPTSPPSQPSQAPARQLRTIPVMAAAPNPSPAPAVPPAQPPLQAEPPKPLEQAAVAAQAPKPTATKTVDVSFALFDPDATQVSLCGDFNGWVPDATPMKHHHGGHWDTAVALAPGRYEYKFLVDGHWIPDPLAHEHIWNHHGTLNSVIEVRA